MSKAQDGADSESLERVGRPKQGCHGEQSTDRDGNGIELARPFTL
jgi:hypothetical protein